MPPQSLPPLGAEIPPELQPSAATLPAIGAEVPPAATSADTVTPMNFAIVNGQRVPVESGGVGGFLSEATQSLNPRTINAAVQAAFWHPLDTAKGVLAAQDVPRQQAQTAFQQGDYLTGTRKLVDWLIPLIGPRLDQAADYFQQGQYARGLGATTDVAVNLVGDKVIPTSLPALPRLGTQAPAEVRQAVAFGLREGIPVDVATATGNRFLRGTQRLAEESMLGSMVGERARGAQAEALTATGARLAERIAPGRPATPETAGLAARQGVVETGQARAAEARAAYREVRRAEENPLLAESVPEDLPRPVKERLREELGGALPTPAEIQELRRIREELDAVPYSAGKLVRDNLEGDTHYVPRSAGASVYHDILQEAPGTAALTRGDVQRSIEVALKTGRLSNGARGALAVAKKRLSEGGWRYQGLSSPLLPPEAGMVPIEMNLPVDLQAFNAAVEPLYTQLLREKELTGLLPGAKGRTLVALDTLRTGGGHAPLSVVDAALSDLKGLARAEIPALKTAGEGVAGAAVQQLDAQVRAAAERAGPEVLAALERGRAATRAKYVARDLVKALGAKAEGVGIYRKATAAQDANAALLRNLAEQAPESLPLVGRAFLEDLLQKATAEGGFSRAAGLWADWQKLGPQTKQLLFRDPAHIKDLDDFFLLAKKMAENPNPSGSALTLAKGGELTALVTAPAAGVPYTLGAPVIAKLLLSPTTTRLLLQGLRLPVSARVARLAWLGQLGRALAAPGPALSPALAGTDGAGATSPEGPPP